MNPEFEAPKLYPDGNQEPIHVIESQQFTPEFLDHLFEQASMYKDAIEARALIPRILEGRLMVSFFYEESTRTRLSFEIAAKRLGMDLVSTTNAAKQSSVAKGETLEDTIEVLDHYYGDVIVLRNSGDYSSVTAAGISDTPIINGGAGKEQHPTQALLDTFTIRNKLERLDNLNIMCVGDLAAGRTARSMVYVTSQYENNRYFFVSPEGQEMGQDLKDYLDSIGVEYHEANDPEEFLSEMDVAYWMRSQVERGSSADNEVVLTLARVAMMKEEAIAMHPLPKVNEIAPGVEEDPRATWMEQSGNGLPVRMALLRFVVPPHSEIAEKYGYGF